MVGYPIKKVGAKYFPGLFEFIYIAIECYERWFHVHVKVSVQDIFSCILTCFYLSYERILITIDEEIHAFIL
jgi:hypothetical protein